MLLDQPAVVVSGHLDTGAKVSANTVSKVHKLLKSAFNKAVVWKYTPVNPVIGATLPECKAAKRAVWSDREAIHALDVCDHPVLRIAMYLALGCSMRLGEILGLQWDHVFMDDALVASGEAYLKIDRELRRCSNDSITSDQDSTFDFLSSLFLSFVFIRLVRYADEHCPGGELPVPVHVLGEELCACGVIPDLSRKISVIRSRNLSMSCVFQNLAGLQNRYPYNQWQEILGNCDVQLFLGCTDALTAEFISDRTGEASISVTSKAKQLGTWRVSNYTPEYRETSGVGRRKLMTMDEVLRMDIDKALILIRGKNVLEVDKYDYSKHPEAKKLRPSKAASHVPAWRANQPQEKQTPSAPPSQAAEKKPAQKKKPAPAEKVVAVTKESIMKKKEDT